MDPAALNCLRCLGLVQIAVWLVTVLSLLNVGIDYVRTAWKPQGEGVGGLSGLFGALVLIAGTPLLGAGLWVDWKLRQGDWRTKPVAFAPALVLLPPGGVAALTVGVWAANAAAPLPWSPWLGVSVAYGLFLAAPINAGYVTVETFSRSGS